MGSNTAQREDVFNEQERKKLSERRPTFKRIAESSERTCAELFFSKKLGEDTHQNYTFGRENFKV